MGEIKFELIIMLVCMSVVIVGAVAFIVLEFLGAGGEAFGGAAWGCCAATAIYMAGWRAIGKLRKRIEELEAQLPDATRG